MTYHVWLVIATLTGQNPFFVIHYLSQNEFWLPKCVKQIEIRFKLLGLCDREKRENVREPCVEHTRKTMLSHNRVFGSNHRKREIYLCTRQWRREECTQDVYVENPEREKPREFSNSNYHYVQIYNNGALRQRPQAHYSRHRRRLQTEATTSSSLTLSLSLCTHSHSIIATTIIINY